MSVDDSVKMGFLDVQLMIKIFKALLSTNINNRLFHVSSSDFMTRYEFAQAYAKAFKKDGSIIQRTSVQLNVDKNRNMEGDLSQNYTVPPTLLLSYL